MKENKCVKRGDNFWCTTFHFPSCHWSSGKDACLYQIEGRCHHAQARTEAEIREMRNDTTE